MGNNNNSGVLKFFGVLMILFGLVSLIWLQVTQDTFSIFACIALVLGVAIFYLAGKKN